MQQEIAEKRVKALQKEFLVQIEQHPILQAMDPVTFNALRKHVFRGTFEAYRLGVVGLDSCTTSLWEYFFFWLDESLDAQMQDEVAEMCFRVALESYRLGAMVAESRKPEEDP